MAEDKRINESISRWLEETAPPRLPERVLDTTFERTRSIRQQVGWRAVLRRFHIARFAAALGAAAFVVMAGALALGLFAGQPGTGGPAEPDPFAGNWEATDVDGSHETMEVLARPNGTYEVTVRDDRASLCSQVPSTMTGVAVVKEPGAIVIEQPDYVCDDGSQPQVGDDDPPLDQELKNLTFAYEADSDQLHDTLGLVWGRAGAAPTPVGTGSTTPEPSDNPSFAFAGNWENDQETDGGHQTMDVITLSAGTYDVMIRDSVASVCGGVPSTMTGVAEASEPGTIVISQPDYACDDGSDAQALSGPPLLEQLQNLAFTYDPVRDELHDSFGLAWSRVAMGP